ncbi:MAG TPA: hypothetical protein VH475_27785 [Tepidisphaeraceae bacterium]|jgi:hypothetical protein
MPSIPQDLMTRLREANDQFHQARLRLNDLDQMDREKRNEAAAALRAAEKDVEDVTREISTLLASDSGPGAPGVAGGTATSPPPGPR